MVDLHVIGQKEIVKELDEESVKYWFDFKQRKFLHNIDTFYYSVKFHNDFTKDSEDIAVKRLRAFFLKHQENLRSMYGGCETIYFDTIQETLNLIPLSFARFYTICLECPDYFDIFIAPVIPSGTEDAEAATCEMVIQIRSYMLWMYGLNGAFEKSYEYVKGLADFFDLEIAFAQENRVDYCWHSNYLSNPEKFFAPEKFYKMRVDRFKDANIHTEKVGSDGYEIDFVGMGKRSDKVYVRIYLKSKEVVEKGYKPWFFHIWFLNGLINRYDLYVYEECFKMRSWKYLDVARCKFYMEYGRNEFFIDRCREIVEEKVTISPDALKKLADMITPKVNLIMNVEYQTTRRHSKTYELLPFRDNSSKETAKRIYDYFDNRYLISQYLTHDVFRLVEPEGDVNKSRRDYVGFWKALRSCKMVDVHKTPDEIKLTRDYSRKLNAAFVKQRVVKSSVTLGIYTRGLNDESPLTDVMDALCMLNDNDIHDALRFKNKKLRQFNADELTETNVNEVQRNYKIIDAYTGELLSDCNTDDKNLQV